MKTTKLSLNRETIQQLDAVELNGAKQAKDTSIGIVCTYFCATNNCVTVGAKYTCNGSVGIACTAINCKR